ncbi:hypothetical protein [Streptomyces beihaiensis]|uniref:Uncharacterized protein n=1 Tax=Streptomyces beihaiensis TaxID=2984495 RepID=A0ABT3U3X3_9ACTN|nr:hypothetical protein [Streptomyces beihaiensis]MCX3063282.1 hypothetical protein [Streptomyces beihaiensis]
MNCADHLATIDLLWASPYPADHGESAAGRGGPGYVTAELNCRGEQVGSDASAEQADADRDGLGALLTARWGEPYRFSLWSVQTRGVEFEEEIPEPWARLSGCAQDVHLWRAGERWVALAVTRQGEHEPWRLLAVVTDTDPP